MELLEFLLLGPVDSCTGDEMDEGPGEYVQESVVVVTLLIEALVRRDLGPVES